MSSVIYCIRQTLKYLLLLTTLSPLVVFDGLLYTFNFSKVFFFRVIVEIIIPIFLLYFFLEKEKVLIRIKAVLRNPLFLALAVFFFFLVLSAFTALNVYPAFWGNVERGEGLFNLAHYFLFLFILICIFEKKDWFTFIKLSLLGGVIMIFYAWQQYFDFPWPFFRLVFDKRPGSFLGNPAFLSVYLILIAAFAGIVLRNKESSRFYRISSVVFLISFIPTILVANVRGSILGFLAGLVFLLGIVIFYGEKKFRKLSAAFLLCLALFAAVFFFTRDASFWKGIPGLNRLSAIKLTDPSFRTRFLALKTSWEAFKEKPILGWGIENYNVAYNKYYNPSYAIYEEAWFDRAHNKIAEVAVTQGIMGLLAYLGIFASVFYLLLRRAGFALPESGVTAPPNAAFLGVFEKWLIAAAVVAYFVQNLFLFDTPAGLFLLFFIFSLVIWNEVAVAEKETANEKKVFACNIKTGLSASGWVVFILSAVGVVYILYNYNYVPYAQARDYQKAVSVKMNEEENAIKVAKEADKFLYPYNFMQPAIRFALLELANKLDLSKMLSFNLFNEKAVLAMEEVVARNPDYEPRYIILLVETYNERGKYNAEFFKKSEEHLRHALALSPKRQDIYYLLAFALSGQGRYEEAVEVSRQAVALEPKVARAHYNLGLELALARSIYWNGDRYVGGEEIWDEAEYELGLAQDIGFLKSNVSVYDLQNMVNVYNKMLYSYILNRDKERVLRIAEKYEKLKRDFGVGIEGIDVIADFAKKGEWEALKNSIDASE